jgi:hypothetical protein
MTRPSLLCLLALTTIAACSQASASASSTRDVIYAFGESHSMFVLDPNSGRILAQPGPLPAEKYSPVLSSDSSTLFFAARDATGAAIYALDAHSFTVQRWLELKHPPNVPNDSLWITGGQLAVAPGGGDLYAGDGIVGNTSNHRPSYIQRVAIIDTASRTVEGSLGPLYSRVLTALPAGPVAPRGALIAMIYSPYVRGILSWLVVIDPLTRTVIDSIAVPMPAGEIAGEPHDIVPAPDGRRVYLIGFQGIYGYDLVARQLFRRVDVASFDTHLAVSPDGSRVYLINNGTSTPGVVGRSAFPAPPAAPVPTTIRVFDASLVEQAPISLATPGNLRVPVLILHDIAVSRDNASLYLQAGNRKFFAEGMLRVLVVNLSTGKIAHVIPLGVWSRGMLVVGN